VTLLLTLSPSTKSQKSKWDRLEALNKKRTSSEALILARMKSIEILRANIASELGAIFKGRIEEIHENTAKAQQDGQAVKKVSQAG
jgi:hypothetical protein